MTTDARLERALSAPAAPAGDPAFVLAVIERAERERFRTASVLTLLRGAGLAAAAAALAVPLAEWGAAHSEALQSGLLAAGGLLALAGATRFMTEQTFAAWMR
jgi:hypothetical protein